MLLLCDYAEAANGKLNIIGGGWSQMRDRDVLTCSLAVRLSVPWDRANDKVPLRISLLDDDGRPVLSDSVPVQVTGEFESGRPAGLIKGEDLTHTLAMRVEGVPLAPGMYKFVLEADGAELAHARFRMRGTG